MKIFNWVQRRFHHGALKDGLAQNVKKAESIKNEAGKQALLKQVALVDVLDGWQDGVLTIGTLGLDPLKPFIQHNEYLVLESEEDDDERGHGFNDDEEDHDEQFSINIDNDNNNADEEEEEENPLIFTRYEHDFEDIGSNFEQSGVKSEEIMTVDSMENALQTKRKGERITLAQLFLAESDMNKKPDSAESDMSFKKPPARANNSLSFAKKLIPHAAEDSRPIKKFNQLMRRMLKRKIHPELEGRANNKTDHQTTACIAQFGIKKGNKAADSVSLLPNSPPGFTV